MPRLRLVHGGCRFEWLNATVEREALSLLDVADTDARYELRALLDRLETGRLRPSLDYKHISRQSEIFELRLEASRPRLRLYFAERRSVDAVLAAGLLLAVKPSGDVSGQRRQQNTDIDVAAARWRQSAP